MNYSEDDYLFFLNKINDFVWEPFDEVLSRFFIFYWVDVGISCYEVQSSINLQKEVIPQPCPLIFIPGVGFL